MSVVWLYKRYIKNDYNIQCEKHMHFILTFMSVFIKLFYDNFWSGFTRYFLFLFLFLFFPLTGFGFHIQIITHLILVSVVSIIGLVSIF